jgi:hypothetical protein
VRNVTANNDRNKPIIAEAGGIQGLADALRMADAPAAVSEQACAAVGNLATNAANRQAFAVGLVDVEGRRQEGWS